MTKITAHCLACNEERWVWYAVMSVIHYVDEVLVWDAESADNTAQIVQSINSPKIKFKRVSFTPDETSLSKARQLMLSETSAGWLMILDGDEVWPDTSLQSVCRFINTSGADTDSVVVPTLNCVGDVFHISPFSAGKYSIAGRTGHYNLRFINLNRIKNLHVSNKPGQLQSYFDSSQTKIQDRDPKHLGFLNAPYLHMTHLARSNSRQNEVNVFWRAVKKKYELGLSLPFDFSYPKCFYYPHPSSVRSPFIKRDTQYILNALWQTPLRKFKRRFLDSQYLSKQL